MEGTKHLHTLYDYKRILFCLFRYTFLNDKHLGEKDDLS